MTDTRVPVRHLLILGAIGLSIAGALAAVSSHHLAKREAAQAAAPAFGSVHWGASEADIQTAFPGAVKDTACTPLPASVHQRTTGEVTFCGTPRIREYDIGGVPFEVRFGVDTEKRALARIEILRFRRGGAKDEALVELVQSEDAAVEAALTKQYGAPWTDHHNPHKVRNATWTSPGTLVVMKRMRLATATSAIHTTAVDIIPAELKPAS